MAQVISEVAEMLNQLASFPGGSGAMIFLTRVYGGYHKLVRWGYIPTYNVWEPLPAMRVFFFKWRCSQQLGTNPLVLVSL